ncbi:MAG: glycine cleavage T C-terminal barrel domain-containing protein [Pyrinomonadaceae bacterium]
MMNNEALENYERIRGGSAGFYEQKRGLIAVWGKEAVQFLDGLITNDMKTLADGAQILAAFPNAQGRLLAVVRVLRQGDRFLFETEEATREKLFLNLFRFTYAGDFFVEDLSDQHRYFEVWGEPPASAGGLTFGIWGEPPASAGGLTFTRSTTSSTFIPVDEIDPFLSSLSASQAVEISDDLFETLRIENGVPKYGIDMDETTIVPELGLDGLISYNKGCYIGQEIIARIHFRGHVAKRLTGLVSAPGAIATGFQPGAELTTAEGKNAGRLTSVTFSPKLEKTVALAFVRYDHLLEGTQLNSGEANVEVRNLPFILENELK